MSLRQGDVALTGPPTQRRRLALLALLAVARDKGISRDKLLAVLWPEGETEKARHALNQILSAQRKHFAGADLFDGKKTVRLNPSLITSDVAEFHDALTTGNLDAASELYAGPFLDGFFLQGSTEFETWASDQRTRFANLLGDALDAAASRAHQSGDKEQSIKWRRRALELDRTDTGRALRLATLLVESGNRPAALRVLQDCQKRIRDELGLLEDPEISRHISELTR